MLFRGNFLYYRNLHKGIEARLCHNFSVFVSVTWREQTWVAAQLAAKKLPIRARSGDATQVFINDLNLKLQNAGKHSGKTLNCWLNLHQYWLRSRKLHSFTFQTYLKVDHWRRWWFTDHDDINSGEIGFDKNIRFLSLSNKIMEEISHFYINMRITAASLSNWREIACLFILFLILSSK